MTLVSVVLNLKILTPVSVTDMHLYDNNCVVNCVVGDEKNAAGSHGESLESRLCGASGEVHQAVLVTW